MEVQLHCLDPEANIFYTLDGIKPDHTSRKYVTPIRLNQQTTLKAVAMKKGWVHSLVMEQTYMKGLNLRKENDHGSIQMTIPPDVRGDSLGRTQFDGVFATSYHTDKSWSVWRTKNAKWNIKFNELTSLDQLIVTYLDHTGMNIFPPKAIQIHYSMDGISFHPLAENTEIPVRETLIPHIKRMSIPFPPTEVKELAITVKPFGPMPDWYKGSGQPANLYIGELVIN